MRPFLTAAILCLTITLPGLAQQADATPASRADIQTYFETVHSRDSINKMMDSMAVTMRKLIHDQYLKNKDKLPENYEEQVSKQIEDTYKSMPVDEMLQAMIPIYQKHFTKGDIYSLLAFYSSPTGQKLLRDMPAITAEAMDAMTPTLTRYMDDMQEKLQRETQEMIKESEKKTEPAPKN
ncbi:MAG: DUF2059 domain-containing protein [Terriglobales bacterium]